MRRICLINPPTSIFEPIYYFPLALVTLAGVLKKADYDVTIVDFDFIARQDKSLWNYRSFIAFAAKHLKQHAADVFGISSICSNFPLTIGLVKFIRNEFPDSKIILGGPQPSSVAEETLAAFPEVDIIVVGEGEQTLCDILASDLTSEALSQIPGLALHVDGKVVRTAPRPLTDNLDDYPHPDYSLIPMEEYKAFASKSGIDFYGRVEVGRGCPFQCTFCSTAIMWQRDFRVKSSARILDEMRDQNRRFGFSFFEFSHDNFTTSRKFIIEFCNYFLEHNTEKFTWYASSRVDCIDESRLQLMADAGCIGLFFGIETASPRMQKVIKKNLDLDKFDPILKKAVGMGMNITTAFIVGFPEETEDDLNLTIRTAFRYKSYGTRNVSLEKLAPLAGTPVYHDHFDQLVLERYVSTISPMPVGGEELVDMIRQYPNLFSSFYNVPAPHLQHIPLPALIVFFHTLIENLLGPTLKLFDWMSWQPVALFFKWMEWRQVAHPGATIEPNFIYETFPDFTHWLMQQDSAGFGVKNNIGAII